MEMKTDKRICIENNGIKHKILTAEYVSDNYFFHLKKNLID